MSHTILLVQSGARPETRTYSDYESVNECMEGVCKIYEEHLKRKNPNTPTITYDISQLFDFVDQVCPIYRSLTDLPLTSPPSSWQISVASCTKSRQTPTHRTTRNGSRRKSTCSCDRRPGTRTDGGIERRWGNYKLIPHTSLPGCPRCRGNTNYFNTKPPDLISQISSCSWINKMKTKRS